jgi:hypothetical protein
MVVQECVLLKKCISSKKQHEFFIRTGEGMCVLRTSREQGAHSTWGALLFALPHPNHASPTLPTTRIRAHTHSPAMWMGWPSQRTGLVDWLMRICVVKEGVFGMFREYHSEYITFDKCYDI